MFIADHILNAEPVHAGSQVYKAARADGILSAVQVFPFEISVHQYEYFQQHIRLLVKVATEYHAAIPKPLSWGFIKAGSFPYIEMEWVEGMNLCEKINANSGSTLPVKEVMIIAEQISRILTLCHNLDLPHAALKEQNILWDRRKSRFVLTGFNFGLGVNKEEKEKVQNTLPYEVVVPATKEVHALQRKDIHDLGLVLFHLLKGHFSMEEGKEINWGEAGQNILTGQWMPTKEQENVPAWLMNAVRRSLSDDVKEQFHKVSDLYHYVLLHHKTPLQRKAWYRSQPQQDILPKPSSQKPAPSLKRLKIKSPQKETRRKRIHFVFDRYIAGGLFIALLLTGFSMEVQKKEKERKEQRATAPAKDRDVQKTGNLSYSDKPAVIQKEPTVTQKEQTKKLSGKPIGKSVPVRVFEKGSNVQNTTVNDDTDLGAYKVRSKAYFHTQPDESTRRNAFIVHWNNAVLHPKEERNDFVYVVFTNHLGQTSRGWLRKKDLIKIGK
jgi:serine/threonine-protein kinase